MDQVKIGSFLKELRKERNLTQESLAEKQHTGNHQWRKEKREHEPGNKRNCCGYGGV